VANIIFPTPLAHLRQRATPEAIFRRRRQILKRPGFLDLLGAARAGPADRAKDAAILARRNSRRRLTFNRRTRGRFILDRPITEEITPPPITTSRFSASKPAFTRRAARLKTSPWQIDVTVR